MFAAGVVELDAEALGAAEVVADEASAVPSVDGGASPVVATGVLSVGDGVDAAVSSTAEGASILESVRAAADADVWEALVCASSDVAPVLARLCLGWSASEGERDRFRVVSASGMVVNLVVTDPRSYGLSAQGCTEWKGLGCGGRSGSNGFGFWKWGASTVRWGMREGREDSAAISATYLLHVVLYGEHDAIDDELCVVKDGRGRASCCRRCALALLISGTAILRHHPTASSVSSGPQLAFCCTVLNGKLERQRLPLISGGKHSAVQLICINMRRTVKVSFEQLITTGARR
jgi:hypothetical protein